MHISRIEITNFRNFRHLEVQLGTKTVVVGENNVGKSNLLFALRLLLDPSLADSSRHLRSEDFWDGLAEPLKAGEAIEIVAEIQGFEANKAILAVLQLFLVDGALFPTARFTYRFRPRSPQPKGRALTAGDYEFLVFGGVDEKNRVGYNERRWLPLDLLPALRDAESDLSSWRRSPLRPLIERLQIDDKTLESVATAIDAATGQLKSEADVKALEQSIDDRLSTMVGKFTVVGPSLGFASTKPDRLLRTLNMFGDGSEKRPIGELSLGISNVLYLLLLAIELERKEGAGERATTLLAIEEPEAHLHPHMQRLLFRDFLRRESPLLLTTHSPHIASVAPLQSLLLLREDRTAKQTVGRSVADAALDSQEVADLERYLDATRAEMLFARGVILVEGPAELFIVPAIAEKMGMRLDEYGVTVCSVHGTDFAPYVKMLGPAGLSIPFVVVTDGDPYEASGKQQSRGLRRAIANAVLQGATTKDDLDKLYDSEEWDMLRERVREHDVFVGSDTLELDLADAGLLPELRQSLVDTGVAGTFVDAMDKAIAEGTGLGPDARQRLMSGLERVGKGRFAQRLAGRVDEARSPEYIKAAVARIVEMVQA